MYRERGVWHDGFKTLENQLETLVCDSLERFDLKPSCEVIEICVREEDGTIVIVLLGVQNAEATLVQLCPRAVALIIMGRVVEGICTGAFTLTEAPERMKRAWFRRFIGVEV